MLAAAVAAPRVDLPQAAQKVRDPNRRPLLIEKDMFARMQETQRVANAQQNFPKIDLALYGTAALRIVFNLPNADQLIIKQAFHDLAERAKGLEGSTQSS
jgi:hypothetical protein